MWKGPCEACGVAPPTDLTGETVPFDYCITCSRDLCNECMARTKCLIMNSKHTPMLSLDDDDKDLLEEEIPF